MSSDFKFCYECSDTFAVSIRKHREREHDGAEYVAYDFASRIRSFARQRQESFWDSWQEATA